MEPDVINKLREALGGELSEAQVVYILTLVRKILDYRNSSPKFSYLRFFSDWALHVRVDRAGAKRALRQFDEWFLTLAMNEREAADGGRFFILFAFHLEFKWFL